VLIVVAAVMEVLVAEVVEVVIVYCFGWRSEAFLEFFSICKGNLKDFFNPKYRFTVSSI
jgi:hypothetical protein